MKKLYISLGITTFVAGIVATTGSMALADQKTSYKQAFGSTLSGLNEVPPITTEASGEAIYKVSGDEQKIDYKITVKNAKDITAGHIHCGVKGTNGPVIVPLYDGTNPVSDGELISDTITAEDILPAAAQCSPNITTMSQLVQAMREGSLYTNLHNAEHPSGLIRDQITDRALETKATEPTTPPPTTETPQQPVVSDSKVFTTSNPDGSANDAIVGLNRSLQNQTTTLKNIAGITSIQSLALGSNGKGHATYDAANKTGGVLHIKDVTSASSETERLEGASTGLVAPKGIEAVQSKSALIVSDEGAKNIKVFSNSATGNTAPQFTVTNLGNTTRSIWDTSYDKANDTLYVAGTDGTVLVYDKFFATKGVDGPTRLMIPSDQALTKLSVNLHGIIYVPERNALVLSDVGSATNATDGQIFTINNAMQTSGRTPVTAQIAGASTKLGNPVDIAYDGQQLYVAEKSNDRVLQFNDIFGRSGTQDTAASNQATVLKPESIVLK